MGMSKVTKKEMFTNISYGQKKPAAFVPEVLSSAERTEKKKRATLTAIQKKNLGLVPGVLINNKGQLRFGSYSFPTVSEEAQKDSKSGSDSDSTNLHNYYLDLLLPGEDKKRKK